MEFLINLQLFTEEKTEKPTSKKLADSRKEGQVLQSKEINSALMLLAAFAMISLAGGYVGSGALQAMSNFYQEYLSMDFLFSHRNLLLLSGRALLAILLFSLPIAGICLVTGLVASYVQVGFLFTTKTLAFKFSRLNPIEGFKRLFSLKSLVELVKSLIKIILIGYVLWSYAVSQAPTITSTIEMNPGRIVGVIAGISLGIGFRAAVILLVLSAFDYLYQKYEYDKNMKMTKQEIKEEFKQTEGNPQIKSKIREKQRQMSLRRMMQDVPKADVVITNPTHFAVAVSYNVKEAQAPRVVAKGQDLIAQRIKKIAGESEIPLVENKPLARALYDQVEVGALIPPEMYQAVAEVLAFVYQMNQKRL